MGLLAYLILCVLYGLCREAAASNPRKESK